VDRQLRGRGGRQGDPGSSQFFVSLEDNLMRLFNSERIAKLMDRMGHQEGEVIQHSMVTKSIERAQKKVEENNFGIRKRLLEYDDVMNIQREAIYKKRNNSLQGERLSVDIYNMFISLAEGIVSAHKAEGSFQTFKMEAFSLLGIDTKIEEASFAEADVDQLVDLFHKEVEDHYKSKSGKIQRILMPVIKNVFEQEGHKYKRIAVPFTDGREKPYPVAAELEKAVETNGQSVISDIEKTVSLSIVDTTWKEHLRAMDELKDSVQAASFEQKDPLVIYKIEAYELFERLIYRINEEFGSYLMKGKLVVDGRELEEARIVTTDMSRTKTTREDRAARAAAEGVSQRSKPETVKREQPKVGRNDPCPCGSGKKYKQCHGKH
jgi:preprotein translocase subunit SecA